ncbi:MAG: lysophospholipid acyltransferase family protein [Gammaproteobacteria bacterium]
MGRGFESLFRHHDLHLIEPRPAWWVRTVASLPLVCLYALGHGLAFLAFRVFPYRPRVVRENLATAFPEFDERRLRRVMREYYSGFAQVLMEIVKSAALSPDEMRRRVSFSNLELVREPLSQGQAVLLLAGHQCNWEWMLLALSLDLGYPLDAAYKPLVDNWAEREMLKIRTRFGARMVPATELLADIIKRSRTARGLAMVADQEPRTSEQKLWIRFLNRYSAFFVGPEEICRTTRYPAFFMGMRRTARGRYEISFTPIAATGEKLAPGVFTERYARLVEEQIHAAPADWPWSHKRWKLRRSLYERKDPDG